MFLLAVLLFRPVEQTVSRAVADQMARGADARAAVRSTARLAHGHRRGRRRRPAWPPGSRSPMACSAATTCSPRRSPSVSPATPPRTSRAGLARRRSLVRRLRPRPARRRRHPARARASAPVRRLPHRRRDRDRRRGRRRGGRAAALAQPAPRRRARPGRRARSVRRRRRRALRAPGGRDRRLRADPDLRWPAARADRGRPGRRGGGGRPVRGDPARARARVRVPGRSASLLPNLTTFQAQGDHARLHRATAIVALCIAGLLRAARARAALAAGPGRWAALRRRLRGHPRRPGAARRSESAASWPQGRSARRCWRAARRPRCGRLEPRRSDLRRAAS